MSADAACKSYMLQQPLETGVQDEQVWPALCCQEVLGKALDRGHISQVQLLHDDVALQGQAAISPESLRSDTDHA